MYEQIDDPPIVEGAVRVDAIKEHPIEIDSVIQGCRICYDFTSVPPNELISPCGCKGSLQYIHRDCLTHWRQSRADRYPLPLRNYDDALKCEICHKKYMIRTPLEFKRSFRVQVTLDILLIFSALNIFYFGLGFGFAYGANVKLSKSFEAHTVANAYVLGFLITHAILGFIYLVAALVTSSDNHTCVCFYWGGGGGNSDCGDSNDGGACCVVLIFLAVIGVLGTFLIVFFDVYEKRKKQYSLGQ